MIEAMHQGPLAQCGLGYEELTRINPEIFFYTIWGQSMSGSASPLPSRGIAFDTWAGFIKSKYEENGFCYIFA